MLQIERIAVLEDNYVWLIHDPVSLETIAVDPALAEPILATARKRQWKITQIWNTHWHGDHTGGNVEIKAATGCRVIGPEDPIHPIPGLDQVVSEGDRIGIGSVPAHVFSTPGHTSVHLSYHIPDALAIFTGDTLFAMGCGRLFEGSAADMHSNMERFAALPPQTFVYCAHEYTQANGRFALAVDPDNEALAQRMRAIDAARRAGEATVPSTIEAELATNPFMRTADLKEFTEFRLAKDAFRG